MDFDPTRFWLRDDKFVRIREKKDGVLLSYKQYISDTADGCIEIETRVESAERTRAFLEHIGLTFRGIQEKKRHAFLLDGVSIDIDEWPKVPIYVELESDTEEKIELVAKKLGFDWDNRHLSSPAQIIENYGIPVKELKFFTFDRIE